jgi:hypothetical protein
MNAFGYISCTSCRYRKHELPDVGDRHRVNGLVAVSRENVGLQPPEGGFGVPRGLAVRPPAPPCASDLLEAAFRFALSGFDLLLLCLRFCLAFGHWINAGGQRLAGRIVPIPGVLERDDRVFPERHGLSLPSNR